jgi:hypothetical protein
MDLVRHGAIPATFGVAMSTLRGPGVTEVAGPTLARVLIETMI